MNDQVSTKEVAEQTIKCLCFFLTHSRALSVSPHFTDAWTVALLVLLESMIFAKGFFFFFSFYVLAVERSSARLIFGNRFSINPYTLLPLEKRLLIFRNWLFVNAYRSTLRRGPNTLGVSVSVTKFEGGNGVYSDFRTILFFGFVYIIDDVAAPSICHSSTRTNNFM